MQQATETASKASRHVAVIGAGIVGVSTALWLLREGMRVTLVDRLDPGEGTSHGNGGVLASSSIIPITVPGLLRKAPGMLFDPAQPLFLKWRYLPKLLPWLVKYLSHGTRDGVLRRAEAMMPIIGDSLADHLALANGTGAEKWIEPGDYVFVYRDRAHFEGDAFGFDIRRQHGFEWEELEGAAWRDYDPAFGPDLGFGARFGGHGRITDPGRYVKDLAAHAERQGARLLKGDVTDFVRSGRQITGLRIGGETLECDDAVLATGVWSGPLAAKMGLAPPLESERGYHLELYEPSIMPRSAVMIASGKFVATPMDGRLRLAGIVEFGGLDAPPSRKPFELLEANIRAAIPGLTWKKRVEWMGHRPSMAHSLPLIGPSPEMQGGWCAFGHDHVGLTGGPKTGRLLAQMIAGRQPNIDLSPYDPAQFRGGPGQTS